MGIPIKVEKRGNLYVVTSPEGGDLLRRPMDASTAMDAIQFIEQPCWKDLGEKLGYLQDVRSRGFRFFDSPALPKFGLLGKSPMQGLSKKGAEISTSTPQVRHPLFNFMNFYVPSDRSNVNTYIRYYFMFHPLIRNGIQLLTDLTISDFSIDLPDPKVSMYFEELCEDLDLYSTLRKICKEYYLLGDDISLWYWDDDIGAWGDINDQLVNELVEVIRIPLVGKKMSYLYFYDAGGIQLFEEMLRKLPEEIQDEIRERMHPSLAEASEEGKKLHLDEFNVLHVRDPQYGVRGMSRVASCLKELLYEDILRYAQWKIAESRAGAVRIYKLGNDSFPATAEHIADFARMMTQFEGDVNPEIYFHHAITAEDVGIAGKSLPIVPELQFVEDRILTALGLNKAITQAEGPAYAPASIAYTAFQNRLVNERRNIEKPIEDKMLKVSIVQGFIRREKHEVDHRIYRGHKRVKDAFKLLIQAELADVRDWQDYRDKNILLNKYSEEAGVIEREEYLIPRLIWHDKMNLETESKVNLAISQYEKGRLPWSYICEIAGWDKNEVAKGLEIEYTTYFNPLVQQALQKAFVEAYSKYLQKKDSGEKVSKPRVDLGFGKNDVGVFDENFSEEFGGGEFEEGEATGLRPGNPTEAPISPSLPPEAEGEMGEI